MQFNSTLVLYPSPAAARCVLVWLAFAVGTGLSGSNSLAAQPPRGDAPAPVIVEIAKRSRQANRQTFVGTFNPVRTSTVGSAVEGRLVEMNVDLGDLVRGATEVEPAEIDTTANNSKVDERANRKTSIAAFKPTVLSGDSREDGDVIARIDSDALDIQIMSAQVELKARQQALEELKLSLPQDIALAEATVAQAQAELEFAKENYERQRSLSRRGGGLSDREIAEARSIFLSRQQALTAAQATLNKLNTTREIKVQIAETAIAAQEKALEQLNEELGRHAIRVLFDGAVVQKMADLGDWVARGTPIVQIVQLDPIELTVQVPQQHLVSLQKSLADAKSNSKKLLAELSVEGRAGILSGEISAIVPQANLRTRSFPVIIRLPNVRSEKDYELKPGMLAKASFDVSTGREVVLVKKDALVLGIESTTVVLAVPTGNPNEFEAKTVEVSIGEPFGDSVEVTEGISEGDRVVIKGNERVRPGQKLRILNQ